jgi:ketosteroid isomerase-like protein
MKLAKLGLLLAASCASRSPEPAVCPPVSPVAPADLRAEVDAFNRALIDATSRMDNAATVALWEDDGVSLLPQTKPIVGKRAIAAFLDSVLQGLPGARMKSFEMECAGVEVAGDVATEYCEEHQVVDLGPGKQPFDGRGKMLLVLHRGVLGRFRLRREMWNQGTPAPKPPEGR